MFARRIWTRWLWLLLVPALACSCDMLNKSSDDESADDDDDNDDKKKKKKKKRKKSDDDDDDDNDDNDSNDNKKASDKPTEAASPPEVPAGTGPHCTAYLKAMACIVSKMPESQRAMMESSVKQMKQALAMNAAAAEPGCKSAVEGIKPLLAQYNCGSGSDTPPSTPGDDPPPPPTPDAFKPGTPATPTPAAPATPGRSKAPTTAEWDAVTKEVTVHGSSFLNCETKMVREWLRCSCRGKNKSGGEVGTVTVTSGGGHGNEFVFNGPGVASLVVRFIEGVDLKARFSWTDRAHTLHVYWPRGAPETQYKGKFLPPPR